MDTREAQALIQASIARAEAMTKFAGAGAIYAAEAHGLRTALELLTTPPPALPLPDGIAAAYAAYERIGQ
jgi:hypothetical protein